MKVRSRIVWASALLLGSSLGAVGAENQNLQVPVPPTESTSGTAQVSSPSQKPRSSGIKEEIVRLLQAKTDPEVIKAFVRNWPTPFDLNADDILQLHDLGASTEILTAVISRGAQLQAETSTRPANPSAVSNPPAVLYPYPDTANTSNTNAPPLPYPSPAPTYSYPAYTYSYLYPETSLPGYAFSPYFWYSPYYRYPYSRYYYPYRYGYYGYRYGYPGRSFGWYRGAPGWHGRR